MPQPGGDFASIAFWGIFPTLKASKCVLLRIAKSPRVVVVCSHGWDTQPKPKHQMITKTSLHMFLADSKLSYSAWGMTESEAAASIRRAYPNVGRLVYLGAQ